MYKTKGYNAISERALQPGRHYNMNYGFVLGTYTEEIPDDCLTFSKYDYNCYLLIVDECSRYI